VKNSKQSERLTAIIVSETHWDRAWYLPFQTFRLRLVRLIDRLLEVLAENSAFHSFLLDGQMLPVQDYLEIRPERRDALREFVSDGRLCVGPWYALADEFLVSPEALIRNLMIGLRIADELGGPTLAGYVPDAFGHIGQLPQILRGFGIESVLFWRGLGDEGEELGDEFWWQAPDGSRILAIHLRHGYHNAANLGYPMLWGDASGLEFDLNLAKQRLREAVDHLKPYNRSGTLLLLNGIDHSEIDPNLPEIIAQAGRTFTDVRFEHGALPDYLARVQAALGEDAPVFQGELNRSRYTFGLQGVYSSRMVLQQANEAAQTLLECYAEPISAWAWLLGCPYPDRFLDLAWRTLIQNHPHDDICGCSVDPVHRENLVRFENVTQIGTPVARDGFRAVMGHIDRTAQFGVPFVVYNPTAAPRTETVSLDLAFDADDPTAVDFHLVGADGGPIPTQIIRRERVMTMEVGKNAPLLRVHLVARIENLPACGYRVVYAQPGPPQDLPLVSDPVQVFEGGMENRHLRLEIGKDGTLTLLDKRTSRRFSDLLCFCDDEDIGDEYDYSPALFPERVSTLAQAATVELLEAGPLLASYQITHRLPLPVAIATDRRHRCPERVTCPITTTLTLHHDSAVVDLRTTVHNQARDHRLRVCFPTDIQTDTATADGHFDVVTRPIDVPQRDDWAQPPGPARHQRYFVDLSDGEAGLAILNRGLAEYEILPDGGRNTIAVTLLRCVGHLSCGDLLTRPAGNAGPPDLATPEAQCQGTHTFEVAVAPHPGDWRAIYADAYRFRAPLYVRCGLEHEGFVPTAEEKQSWDVVRLKQPDRTGDLPAELSFLTLKPEILTLSAVKHAADDDRLIVRFYNPTVDSIEAALRLHWPIKSAAETNLNEEPVSALTVDNDNAIRLTVGGNTVKTIAMRVRPMLTGASTGAERRVKK
jgi:mannosylglycerate hydrolase